MRFRAYAQLLRENLNFRRLWYAQIVSEIGDWFYSLAIYSLILELTGRAELVALAVTLQVLPTTFISPTAGVINDRLSRKQVMIAADLARIVITLGMLFVRTREMVWLIFPLLFLETIGWGFFEPARTATIPNVCDEKDILTANTLSSTTWSFNLAIGATLGGLIAAWLGRDAVFVINAATFGVSAFFLRRMSFPEPHTEGHPPFSWRDLINFKPMVEGFRYVQRDPTLYATMLVKGGLGLIGSNLVLMPLLGERVFPLGLTWLDPQRSAMLGMSVLMGARGVGAILGPLLTTPLARETPSRLRAGIGIAFFCAAAGYVVLSIAPNIWIAMLAIVFSHGSGSTIWVFSTTLLHQMTEDRFRGRVFAAELGVNMAAISLSSYIAGRIIDSGSSPRNAVFVTAMMLIAPGVLWLVTLRRTQPSQ